ncbi:MAG: glycoside hydrolase family 125 protein [Xylanivirga thermophila]|uniref:glycoside hydrolase family 125 protein n=1 Tax=Xylanivirga thermophila TaxID=2496273 RepID=UPI001FB2B3CF|nr:glycoside hydrolase family 125 protein [Xylanivirga thermophila]
MNALISSVEERIEETSNVLKDNEKLYNMFKECFLNTLKTTIQPLDDGTTYVLTGDIPAMWLRDSTAQVHHYIALSDEIDGLKMVIEGLIKRQVMYILIDPYSNSFNKEPNGNRYAEDITDGEQSPWVWERKYEIDSLCYPIQLAYKYWKRTGSTVVFDDKFKDAMKLIIALWKTEQNHMEKSPYRFQRFDCPETDTLKNGGLGTPVGYTGMTWSGFRPSDDACAYGYLIPSNMFAVVVLGYMEEIASVIYKDWDIKEQAGALKAEMDAGIKKYGIYEHPEFGPIYAYETDGLGGYNLMDDANVPSLLSSPYLGYLRADDPIYKNTRKFLLSKHNPYYYEGKMAKGIGSPHTPKGYIWHISLTMQALTSTDEDEIRSLVEILQNTDGGTGYMHEGFDPDDSKKFTRPWFGWANSLFGELIFNLAQTGFKF